MYNLPEVTFQSYMDNILFDKMLAEFDQKFADMWNFANRNGDVTGYMEEPDGE